MSDCLFCKIVKGEIPATKVHEDETVIAFLDLFPVNPGHVLVVPKRHAQFMHALPAEVAAHMVNVGQRLSEALRKTDGVRCEDVNFLVNDGPAAGQEVPHAHLHVIPRFTGDGFGFSHGPGNKQKQAPESLQKVADALKRSA